MSAQKMAIEQPESFVFNAKFSELAKKRIAMYPEGKQASAVVPLLWFAQKQHDNWIPEAALRHIGDMLDMAYIRVLEVVTFYTMFNLAPVGKHFVQFCGTTPCWLNGADKIKDVCESEIGAQNTISDDGEFSWLEVECLGACVNAPMVQINDDFYEDLDEENFRQLLKDLKSGKPTKIGPQVDRINAAPCGGATTLNDKSLFDGSMLGSYKDVLKQIEQAEAEAAAISAKEAKEAEKPAPKKADEKPEASDKKPTKKATKPAKATNSTNTDAENVSDDLKPAMLSAPKGDADDLKVIKGVGPKLEGVLNGLGIYHYSQISVWNDDNIAWVDSKLQFKGRILRDGWVKQAGELAKQGDK